LTGCSANRAETRASDRGGERAAAMYSVIVTANSTTLIHASGSATCWSAPPVTRHRGCNTPCAASGAKTASPGPPPKRNDTLRSPPESYMAIDQVTLEPLVLVKAFKALH
jgi:hypothetical protein